MGGYDIPETLPRSRTAFTPFDGMTAPEKGALSSWSEIGWVEKFLSLEIEVAIRGEM